MTAYKALLTYEEMLRQFHVNLAGGTSTFEESLESGLGFLMSKLNIENAGLFWWIPKRKCLKMQYAFFEGTVMEGEEEIIVSTHNPLWNLVVDRKPVVVSEKNPWVAFIPLCSESRLIGAIRIHRPQPLPRGSVLETLPRWISNEESAPREFPLLEDIADILSLKIDHLYREDKHKKRERTMKAGAEVATAVVETPRLRDMLEAVSNSIIENLGFDRIRFYLIDVSRGLLKGVLGLQIPRRLINLEEEKYPLQEKTNAFVDSVLKENGDQISVTAGGKIACVPLAVGGQVIGCMVVDNLVSQQVIDLEQTNALKPLAGQIGMSVLNARLFEDIEQQAITDGLTGLYVYRYFQQRLKEEIDRADRYSYGVALVMIDVDYFKRFNDTYGHAFGDKVLEFLSQTIRNNIRRIDLASRYGGDEFTLLLPEITEQEAWLMGARLLNTLKQTTLQTSTGEKIHISVTVGVAMYASDARNGRDLMEAADKALYWAKKNNRGDICFYRNISKKPEI